MADADHARLMQQPRQAEARSAASHVTLSSPVAPCTSGSLQLLSPDVFRHIIRTSAAAALHEQDPDEVERLSLVCREARTAVASLITRLSLSPTNPDDGDEQAAGAEAPDGSPGCTGCTPCTTSVTPQGSPGITSLPCATLLCGPCAGSVQQAAAVAAEQAIAEVFPKQQSPQPTSALLDPTIKGVVCGAVKQLLAFPSHATLRTLDVNLTTLHVPSGGAAAGGGGAGDATVSTEVLRHLLTLGLPKAQRQLNGLAKLDLQGVGLWPGAGAMLAAACPQLQEMALANTTLGCLTELVHLPQLACLSLSQQRAYPSHSSNGLGGDGTSSQRQEAALASAAALRLLSGLTSLNLQLCCPVRQSLPHVVAVTTLRSLTLSLAAEELQQALTPTAAAATHSVTPPAQQPGDLPQGAPLLGVVGTAELMSGLGVSGSGVPAHAGGSGFALLQQLTGLTHLQLVSPPAHQGVPRATAAAAAAAATNVIAPGADAEHLADPAASSYDITGDAGAAPALMVCLSRLSSLVSLQMADVPVVGSSAIELLAGMPTLSTLLVDALAPDRAVQLPPGCKCAWRRLGVWYLPNPQQLLWLPLDDVQVVETACIEWSAEQLMYWETLAGSGSESGATWAPLMGGAADAVCDRAVVSQAAGLLLRASQLLACRFSRLEPDPRWGHNEVRMSFVLRRSQAGVTAPPANPSMAGALPAVDLVAPALPPACLPSLLRSLSPLGKVLRELVLHGWPVDASLMQALHIAAPKLQALRLDACQLRSDGWAALLALTSLTTLDIASLVNLQDLTAFAVAAALLPTISADGYGLQSDQVSKPGGRCPAVRLQTLLVRLSMANVDAADFSQVQATAQAYLNAVMPVGRRGPCMPAVRLQRCRLCW